MKKTRFTEQHIAFALRPAERGVEVEETARKMGVSVVVKDQWDRHDT